MSLKKNCCLQFIIVYLSCLDSCKKAVQGNRGLYFKFPDKKCIEKNTEILFSLNVI